MYKRILVPIDGSPACDRGLREAMRLAKNQKAALCLLHVLEQGSVLTAPDAAMYTQEMLRSLEEQGSRLLAKAEAKARQHGLRVKSVLEKKFTAVAESIIRQAKKWPADLIVLGTHGRRGVQRLVMGSDAESVVRVSPVPVLLVRAGSQANRMRRRAAAS